MLEALIVELKTLLCLHPSHVCPINPFRDELGRSRGALLAVLLLIAGMAWKAPVAQAQGVNFGSINVCPSGATTPAPCSDTLPLTFNIAARTTIGSISYLTLGAQNLDYKAEANDTSTGLCSAQTYSSAATCTVDVTFAPVAPGARNGAVEILDGSGNILARTYVYGTGVGPAIAFSPTAQTALGSGFNFLNSPNGVAVDASGDVFVADTGNNAVKEILAVNGSIPANPAINTLGGGFYLPAGVAVDGSGNVFVADFGNNQVKEILATGGYATVIALGTPSSFSSPDGVAVDGSGNVFVANTDVLGTGLGAVTEILAVGGYSTVNTLGGAYAASHPFIAPRGVAVDGSGNVYVTDHYSVWEILAAGGYTSLSIVFNSLLYNHPTGVAVDASGDVYVADTKINVVYEIPFFGSRFILINGLSGGLALNGRGDIFIADHSSPAVLDIQRSQPPPPLIFPNTTVGSSSSPQSIQIQNIGNARLFLSGPSVSENFTLVQVPRTVECNAGFSFAPGTQCNLNISFAPEALGILTGTVTLSDNDLNGNPATQTIGLMGEDLPQAQVSTTSMQFATIPFGGGSKTLPLVVTNIGGGTLTIASSKINGPSYKIASSNCGAGVTAGNSCTLQVEFAPVAVGGHGDILTLQTNGVSNPAVALHGIALGVGTEMETPLEFGTIPFGSTKVLLLTINNLGVGGDITIGTMINGPSYKILSSQNTCLSGIRSRQSCTLPVEFDPVSVGKHDDVLTLIPTGGAAPSTVYLHGSAD
jgi:streptogramin lyase